MSLIDQAKTRVETARSNLMSRIDEVRGRVGIKGRAPIKALGQGSILGRRPILGQGSMLGQQFPAIRDARSRIQSRLRARPTPTPTPARSDIVDTARSAVEGVHARRMSSALAVEM